MAKRAQVIMDLITTKFQKKMKDANKSWKRMKKNIFSVKSAIGVVFAGAAVRQIISVGRDLVKSAEEQQKAEMSVATALRAKGKYTKENFDAITQYASALQSAGVIGDEQILTVQGMLINYGLFGDELNTATGLVLDMVAGSRALQGSVDLLGRAFKGQYGLLSRYGVSMEDVNKAGGGFAGVIKELTKLYPNLNKALAQTPTGKLRQMANAWGDMKEHLGAGVARGLTDLATGLSSSAKNMSALNTEMGALISGKIAATITDIAAGFHYMAAGLSKVVSLQLKAASLTPVGMIAGLIGGESLWTKGSRVGAMGSAAYATAEKLRGSSIATLNEMDATMAGSTRRNKNRAATAAK
jgi:hypothetical protein